MYGQLTFKPIVNVLEELLEIPALTQGLANAGEPEPAPRRVSHWQADALWGFGGDSCHGVSVVVSNGVRIRRDSTKLTRLCICIVAGVLWAPTSMTTGSLSVATPTQALRPQATSKNFLERSLSLSSPYLHPLAPK